ncbi:hypothetical protein BDK51DRAFT_27618 [Blyttiomyces helicus]|uniref:Uncharacterized protein n=1 Tax=Blyttiomyces helicus TaxID=388810 RepID=A0A4P9VXX6_9FUNG|nr:hypothetical protein BDK51DRAFT_27618 [Blyttiomyces helicus]|eukprot:RKO83795.1 hypothetical protein BDK51DRAFT_27618 [Blyttiomyces helicus]
MGMRNGFKIESNGIAALSLLLIPASGEGGYRRVKRGGRIRPVGENEVTEAGERNNWRGGVELLTDSYRPLLSTIDRLEEFAPPSSSTLAGTLPSQFKRGAGRTPT